MIKAAVFLMILTVPSVLWANLQMKIEIEQRDQLQFKIAVKNDTEKTQTWTLNTAAQGLRADPELKILKSRPLQLELEAGKSAQMSYQIPFDTSKNYFLAGGPDSFLPENKNSKSKTQFEVKSKLLEGFEIIHSGTGFEQEGLALVFGQFKKYSSKDFRLRVFLSKPDENLAQTLLDKLSIYLKKFEKEYGPYPYDSFAVVESPDEIGYAFPKMTWMGSQLLRFPFILTTSLPHELLHSWWGNGVFVNYDEGNWCEGLTTFGADYALLDEPSRKLYRLKALSNYSNYVKSGNDIPLSKFTSRGEDRALQAIGYDKVMMIFVMLEQQLGEKTLKTGLQNFYKKFKYKAASYQDLFHVLEETSGQNLAQFQDFWVHSTGFLQKDFLKAELIKNDSNRGIKWLSNGTELRKIPHQPIQILVNSTEKSASKTATVKVDSEGKALLEKIYPFAPQFQGQSYWVDPNFLLFRDLHELEKPVTFSKFFGQSEWAVKLSDEAWLNALRSSLQPTTKIVNVTTLDFSKPVHYILSLDVGLASSQISEALKVKNVALNTSSLVIENNFVDLKQNSVFISFRIKNSYVTLIHINDKLPLVRWFQRWFRYGAQSYVALTPSSALLQGTWIDRFENELQ